MFKFLFKRWQCNEVFRKRIKIYIGELISTTLDINVAKGFAKGGTLLVITIKNNGTEGKNNYCRYIEYITQYPGEEEIIITAFCIYYYLN